MGSRCRCRRIRDTGNMCNRRSTTLDKFVVGGDGVVVVVVVVVVIVAVVVGIVRVIVVLGYRTGIGSRCVCS